MKFLLNILPILLIIVFLFSCKKESDIQLQTGTLKGKVELYDQHRLLLDDNSGVLITLEGSEPLFTVRSDLAGFFKFENLEMGTYNVVYSKDGFGTYKNQGFQFVGGSKQSYVYPVVLFETPQISIDSLKLIDLNNIYSATFLASLKVTDNSKSIRPKLRYFLGNSPNVSYANYIKSDYSIYSTAWQDTSTIIFQFNIDTVDFPIGSELYMIVYPEATNKSYKDLYSGENIYYTINKVSHSNVANITIPEVESW